jgi:hypothetical protein
MSGAAGSPKGKMKITTPTPGERLTPLYVRREMSYV